MGNRARGVLALVILATVVSCGASGERVAITIGMLPQQTSLPFETLSADETLVFKPAPVVQERSLAFPWVAPPPDAINLHPDVINALVGYRYNDLAGLAEQGVIEPLDPVFERMGIDPKAYFLPNAYEAVSWDGHIWAVPHRVEALVFSLDKALFAKIGMEPELATWSEMLDTVEQFASSEALGSTRVAFNSWSLSIDVIASLCLGFADAAYGVGSSRAGAEAFFTRCAESNAFQEQSEWQSAAIYLKSLSSVRASDTMHIARVPAPSAIDEAGGPGRSLGFLECFAIRKNSPEKRAAAEAFLEWLVREQTQLDLVALSRIDMAPAQMAIKHHHVPLSTPVLESSGFTSLFEAHPSYPVLVETIMNVALTPPAMGRDYRLQQIGYAWLGHVIDTGTVNDIFAGLPNLVDDLEAAAMTAAADGTSDSLDEF